MLSVSASSRRHPRAVALAVLALTVCAGTASADVSITTKTVSEGLGGFGNSNETSVRVVTADKSCNESESQYTGRFKTFAGGKHATVQIVRLDRGVVWDIDADKKQYTEMTFEQMRERMRQAAEEMKKASAQAQQEQRKAREQAKDSDVEVTYDVDVNRTGARQTIAGFACEQVIATCTTRAKDKKSGEEAGTMKMTLDGWYAKRAPGEAEIAAFERAYMEKLGMQQLAAQLAPMAASMYGDALKQIGKKLEGVGGYAMKTVFTVEPGDETKQAIAEAKSEQKQAQADAAAASKRAETAQDVSEAADIGATAASGSGGLKAKIGGFLGRKAATTVTRKAEQKATAGSGGSGGDVLFRTETEVVAISTTTAPAGRFEVPAGFKKVEAKGVK